MSAEKDFAEKLTALEQAICLSWPKHYQGPIASIVGTKNKESFLILATRIPPEFGAIIQKIWSGAPETEDGEETKKKAIKTSFRKLARTFNLLADIL